MPSYRRRQFLIALASVLATPRVHALDPATRIGVLFRGSEQQAATRLRAFQAAFGAKRVPGTQSIDIHYGDGSREGLEARATALIAAKPAVILADSAYAVLALRKVTNTVPVVAATLDDPVASRFTSSLESPGGHMTGILAGGVDDLLVSIPLFAPILPRDARIGLLTNANNANYRKARSRFHFAAGAAGLTKQDFLDGFSVEEVIQVLTRGAREMRLAALVVMNDAMFLDERRRIVELVSGLQIPALYPTRAFVDAGGLMSYGPDVGQNWVRAAAMVRRVLAGESVGQVPIEQPAASELALNQKEAARLKVVFPSDLRAKARLPKGPRV